MAVRNIDNNELKDLKDRVRRLESASPSGFTSITRGALRVASAEGLIVEGSERVSGTLRVTGTEIVDGTLRITGTLTVQGPTTLGGRTTISGDTTVTGRFDVDGPVSIDGDLTINGMTKVNGDTTVAGPFHVDGDTDFDGRLTIRGDTSLSGDLDVTDAGHIQVGDMRIGKDGGRGKVDFGTGELASNGTKIAIQSGPAIAGVGGGVADLTYGGNGFRVEAGGAIRIGDLPTTDAAPNLYLDNNNRLWRTSGSTPGTSV